MLRKFFHTELHMILLKSTLCIDDLKIRKDILKNVLNIPNLFTRSLQTIKAMGKNGRRLERYLGDSE